MAAALAVAHLGFLAFTVFWPTADYASGSVTVMSRALYAVGVPVAVTPAMVEFVANIALFVPLSLLGAVLLGRWSWPFWTAVGFCASALIELSQLLLLSGRSASVFDIVANTLGALVGILLIRVARSLVP